LLRRSDEEAPIPSEIPVKTERRLEELRREKDPETSIAHVNFVHRPKDIIDSWWSKFTSILTRVDQLHLVALRLPFLNALPKSPPKGKVSKCNDINVKEPHFGDVLISCLPMTASKVGHGGTNIDEWVAHAGDYISEEEVTESDEAKGRDGDVVERVEKFKSSNGLECLNTWLDAHHDEDCG
jgi:hypothetical protein